jgi:nicotinamidase-related amidase
MTAARDWAHLALLLIDIQRDFWTEELENNFPAFPDNVARLLDFCRAEDLDVVHLRASFKPDMSDWMPTYRLKGSIPCVEGTPGVETLPFALEDPGETIVVKQTFDGFHRPELVDHLRTEGKRFVLTAGLLTSVCVLLTTVSAVQHGFLTAVVEDCCADEPEAHQRTLDSYDFIFDRTTVDGIATRHADWQDALARLDELPQLASETH